LGVGVSRRDSSNFFDNHHAIIERSREFGLLASINLLMVPACNLQIFAAFCRIDGDEPFSAQLVEHRPDIIQAERIDRKHPCLDRDRFILHAAIIIGEVPHADEKQARNRADCKHSRVRPKVRLDGPNARQFKPPPG
jgi:hypothetical protein